MNPFRLVERLQHALVSAIERAGMGVADAIFDAAKRQCEAMASGRVTPYVAVALYGEEPEPAARRTVLGGGYVKAERDTVRQLRVVCVSPTLFVGVELQVVGLWVVRSVRVGSEVLGGGFVPSVEAFRHLLPMKVRPGEHVVFDFEHEPSGRLD